MSEATKVYHYHPTTLVLLAVRDAVLDPIDRIPMVPAHATLVEPPQCGENQAAVFDPVAGTWGLLADYVDHTYWLADGSEHTITELGITPPAEALSAPPPPPPLTDAELVNAVRDAVYVYLDSVAVAKGFRNSDVMIALAGRTNSNPMVNALVQAFASYYELVHSIIYAKAEEVYNGAPAPTPEEVVAFIRTNHPIVWPV